MISNKRQYNVTKGQIKKLKDALELQKTAKDKMDARVYKAMIGGIESQIGDLKKELKAYDALQQLKVVQLSSMNELPEILKKARVASGYTQKELAKELKIKPQQIQRYESTDYETISFKRVCEILSVLGVKFEGRLKILKENTQ